jgi:hypothetical protein
VARRARGRADAGRVFPLGIVRSLSSDKALHETIELVATEGAAPKDFAPLFAALDADRDGALDGVSDTANMPLEEEPQRVREHLKTILSLRTPAAD